jgi:hypothetical protein
MSGYVREEIDFLKVLETLQEVEELYEFRDVFGLARLAPVPKGRYGKATKVFKVRHKVKEKEEKIMAQKYEIKSIHQYKDKDGNEKTSYFPCGWMFRFKDQEKDGYRIKIRELSRDIELLAFPAEEKSKYDVGF